ncbi:DUF397 domain-containing protein [Streptomyces sp. ME02-6991-2A]|uniref:DUF397 domain-containing protein n=1 Tax=Streptomyces sp. ME02-6991-2A TaxID=3028677 RepID=UPI0029B2F5ED|nr:DUF397 domain-containing protein [Streptomyces sp. ME02-6991-2A]MDX3377896.1 DUF397 domain-containing protein [Streptomyces sp. ME02-6991-2A]
MSSTLRWFKSSYSSSSGGDCIEVAFDWRTSSYSSGSGGECVEVAACPHAVHIRDSKVIDGPAFAVAPDAWSTFVTWAD